jgi:hypothetical protein
MCVFYGCNMVSGVHAAPVGVPAPIKAKQVIAKFDSNTLKKVGVLEIVPARAHLEPWLNATHRSVFTLVSAFSMRDLVDGFKEDIRSVDPS